MFWRRNTERKDENYEKVLEILKLVNTQFHNLTKEMEFLQVKYRKIAGLHKKIDDDEEEIDEKEAKRGDSLDKIRAIQRKLKHDTNKIGI